jgi:hypothetical protein
MRIAHFYFLTLLRGLTSLETRFFEFTHSVFLFVSAGMQVGEQICKVGALNYIPEGRHQLAARNDLLTHLGYCQPSTHS